MLRLPNGERVARGVAETQWQRDKLVARFTGVADRDAAAALRGATIEIERSHLPEPREREYYRADLLGLRVRNLDGVELGRVGHFVDAPAAALMVVQAADGQEHWVPATPEYLRKVDLAAGWIEVSWPVEFE